MRAPSTRLAFYWPHGGSPGSPRFSDEPFASRALSSFLRQFVSPTRRAPPPRSNAPLRVHCRRPAVALRGGAANRTLRALAAGPSTPSRPVDARSLSLPAPPRRALQFPVLKLFKMAKAAAPKKTTTKAAPKAAAAPAAAAPAAPVRALPTPSVPCARRARTLPPARARGVTPPHVPHTRPPRARRISTRGAA